MEFWVFGYGSLIWHPGFTPAETCRARLTGFRRSFCMLSIHHRGTEADPGLVLALDPEEGAHCDGLALRVSGGDAAQVLSELRERELVSSAYLETEQFVTLEDGRTVRALTYVVDRSHRQYCRFDTATQARMIAFAHGGRGPNHEYLFNTAAHLRTLGISDPELDALESQVRELTT